MENNMKKNIALLFVLVALTNTTVLPTSSNTLCNTVIKMGNDNDLSSLKTYRPTQDELPDAILCALNNRKPNRAEYVAKKLKTSTATLIETALNTKNTSVAKILAKKKKIKKIDDKFVKQLIKDGHKDIAKYVIKHMTTPPQETLLLTISKKYNNLIKPLLEKGAQVNPDKPAKPPLLVAASADNTQAVIIFLKNGAFLHTTDSDGNTALHIAAKKKNKEMASAIIKRMTRDNVKIKNNDGNTALHIAADNNDKSIAQILVKRGADIIATNNKKETPLGLATGSTKKYLEKTLEKQQKKKRK